MNLNVFAHFNQYFLSTGRLTNNYIFYIQ